MQTEEENCFERMLEIKVYQRYVLCLLMFTGLITNYVSYHISSITTPVWLCYDR